MKLDKITQEFLEMLAMKQTVTVELPSAVAMRNGRSLAYQRQYEMGCRFSIVSDNVNNTLTITKQPRP